MCMNVRKYLQYNVCKYRQKIFYFQRKSDLFQVKTFFLKEKKHMFRKAELHKFDMFEILLERTGFTPTDMRLIVTLGLS